MRTLVYFAGAVIELLAYFRPRLGWRRWQRLHVWFLHARDLGACLVAIFMLVVLAALFGA